MSSGIGPDEAGSILLSLYILNLRVRRDSLEQADIPNSNITTEEVLSRPQFKILAHDPQTNSG